jgi:hypothetical protein
LRLFGGSVPFRDLTKKKLSFNLATLLLQPFDGSRITVNYFFKEMVLAGLLSILTKDLSFKTLSSYFNILNLRLSKKPLKKICDTAYVKLLWTSFDGSWIVLAD